MDLSDQGYFLNPQQDDLQVVSDELVSWFLDSHPERLVGLWPSAAGPAQGSPASCPPPARLLPACLAFECSGPRFPFFLFPAAQSRASLGDKAKEGKGEGNLDMFGAQGTASSQPQYYQPTLRKQARPVREAEA